MVKTELTTLNFKTNPNIYILDIDVGKKVEN